MSIRPILLLCVIGAACFSNVSETDLISFPEDRTFLPKSWIASPINADIEPLKEDCQVTVAAILNRAVAKYPSKLIERSLNGISVVGSLRFYDVGYGGTYMANSKRIVLVYRDTFDPRGFEQRLHHEFSSLLLKQNESSFESNRWTTANDPHFTYRAGGVVEEQNGDRAEATKVLEAEQKKTGGSGSSLLQIDPILMEKGFLTPYNQVSIEHDLNETAAHLFTNPELWNLCSRYPRLDQKVDTLIDFYRTLDPAMDRLFFRRLTEEKSVTSTP